MADEAFSLQAAFDLPPKDAVAYFEAKGYKISWNWWETWQEAHAGAFTVAKAVRGEVLEAIRGELQSALDAGTTERDFLKVLEPRLQALGWWGKQVFVDSQGNAEMAQLGSPWRLKTIYRVNLQSAYMAGRYKQMMENSDARPWWQYVAILDSRTRPTHRALNGRVFRFDDPFWEWFYPPNGWNCRCRVRAYTDQELSAKGLTAESSAGRIERFDTEVGVDKRTGEQIFQSVPGFKLSGGANPQWFKPDAGWGYNPGQSAFGRDVGVMRSLTQIEDRGIRAQAVQALNNSPLRQQVFADWVEQALSERRAGHAVQVLGFVAEDVADWAREKSGEEPSRVLALPEKSLLHADSEKHQAQGVALSLEEYQSLPQLIAQPEAVLWDSAHENLLYVGASGDGRAVKIVVNMPYRVKGHPGRLDAIVNVYKVDANQLEGAQYERME